MYSVNRAFLKDLKLLDNRLDCEYDIEVERFVITYERATGGPVPVLIVGMNEGYFRQPDKRDIEMLWRGDNARISPKERILRTAKYMEDYRETRRRYMADEIRAMTKDGVNQLKPKLDRLRGSGKGNATFRRIDRKKKRGFLQTVCSHSNPLPNPFEA